MKKFVLLIAAALFILADADAFDVKLLSSNKEAISRELTKRDRTAAVAFAQNHVLKEQLKSFALKALSDTFNEMERVDTNCELGLVKRMQADALKYRVISTPEEITSYFAYLREQELIDDLLFKLLKDSQEVAGEIAVNLNEPIPSRPFNLNTRQNAGINLKDFYSPLKQWPDDIGQCSFDVYFDLVMKLTFKNAKDRDSQISKLNWMAVKDGIIDLQTFNRLETLKKKNVLDWNLYFKRYADIVNNAKDKMTKSPEAKSTNDFSVEYVSRREGLTQRGNLFRTFNSTQVIMLSQIIERTAKRMDAKQASLNWQFSDNPNDREIYVLSPMEQYRAAIKMLRKEMAEVMRSEAFKNTALDYDHIIAAAFETGFIKSNELEMILKFEDFWNPKTPKWKAYANFAFTIAGTASFYLPPPWNVIGAVGLILTQTKLLNGDQKPDPDDNWNVII